MNHEDHPHGILGWTDEKSIVLTKFLTLAAAAGCVVMTLCGPVIVHWVMESHGLYQEAGPGLGYVLLGLGYICAALALWMLWNLYHFLRRTEQGSVFVTQNVTELRRISWCCTWAAVLCLPTGAVVGLPFIFAVGLAAGFMALIVRVVKNAFAQAVRMKDELDYTV